MFFFKLDKMKTIDWNSVLKKVVDAELFEVFHQINCFWSGRTIAAIGHHKWLNSLAIFYCFASLCFLFIKLDKMKIISWNSVLKKVRDAELIEVFHQIICFRSGRTIAAIGRRKLLNSLVIFCCFASLCFFIY